MNINKYTEKAQEAVLARAAARRADRTMRWSSRSTCWSPSSSSAKGIVPEVLAQDVVPIPATSARAARELLSKIPQAYGGAQPGLSPRLKIVTDLAEAEADAAQGRIRQHRAPAHRHRVGDRPLPRRTSADRARPDARQDFRRADQRARLAARDEPEPRGHLPGARALRPRPDRARAQGQARSGDRPRRGNPPRHPGAVAPHQEQSGADRRARRRQDRDRRRTGRPDRPRRRPGRAQEQADRRARHGRARRRREVPRRVRRAAEGGAQGNRRRAGPGRFCSSTSCIPWSAPAPPKDRWTRRTC